MLDNYRAAAAAIADNYGPLMRAALYDHVVPAYDGDPAGAALSFRDFPFLVEPYACLPTCRDMVISKCTLAGWTEMTLAYMLEMSRNHGRRVVYCLPNEKPVRSFVQARVNDTVDRSPSYRQTAAKTWRDKAADNIGFRHFGAGWLRFIGARSETNFKEYTADIFIIDEYDALDAAGKRNVPMADDRLWRSPHPQQIRIANPTLAGQGIDELYQESDRRRWTHTCTHCGHRQAIDWFTHVLEKDGHRWRPRDRERAEALRGKAAEAVTGPEDDLRPVCVSCEQPFDRHHACRWVAQSPGRHRRGYRMAQYDIPSVTLWKLWRKYCEVLRKPEALRKFYSGALGIPYAVEGSKVTDEDLRAARGEHLVDHDGGIYEDKIVIAGIDVGAPLCNVTLSTIETVPVDPEEPEGDKRWQRTRIKMDAVGWAGIDDLMERYAVKCAVIDWQPEIEKAKEWQEKWQERGVVVYRCRFHTTPQASTEPWAFELLDSEGIVKVERTGILDETFADLRNGGIVLPADCYEVPDFVEQMKAPVRQLNKAGSRYVWEEGSKADHYRLADGYERVALEIWTVRGGGVVTIDLDTWSTT